MVRIRLLIITCAIILIVNFAFAEIKITYTDTETGKIIQEDVISKQDKQEKEEVMIVNITINDKFKGVVLETLESLYGREIDTIGAPTQTDEEYLEWAFKKFLKHSIREGKRKKFNMAIESEDITF